MADDAVWERQVPEKEGQEELTHEPAQLSQVLSVAITVSGSVMHSVLL